MKPQKNIIISTRPVKKNDGFKNYLAKKNFTVIDFPMIEIIPVEINDNIKKIFSHFGNFSWIIFTSSNSVEIFFRFCNQLNIDLSIFSQIKIASVGRKTAETVKSFGVKTFLTSSGNTSGDLLTQLKNYICNDDRVLLPLGALASNTLEKEISPIAVVVRVDLYQTAQPASISKEILKMVQNNNYDLIAFSSPSQVKNFMNIIGHKLHFAKFACIGKTTESEVLKHGISPLIVSPKSDAISFAKVIEKYIKTINQ